MYDDDAGTGEWLTVDVTDRVPESLFQDVLPDPDVTLADVFRQEFVSALCAEVRKGPAKMHCHILQVGKSENITLGNLIREIMWELSWHGMPEDRETFSQDLMDQMAELDAGTAKTTPHEDVFESLGFVPTKVVYDKFFTGSEDVGQDAVYRTPHDLDANKLAHVGLQSVLDQVRPEFAGLTGRALRKAVRSV